MLTGNSKCFVKTICLKKKANDFKKLSLKKAFTTMTFLVINYSQHEDNPTLASSIKPDQNAGADLDC